MKLAFIVDCIHQTQDHTLIMLVPDLKDRDTDRQLCLETDTRIQLCVRKHKVSREFYPGNKVTIDLCPEEHPIIETDGCDAS